MKGLKTETKVGIFVVLGLFLLAYMTIKVEKLEVGAKRGYTIFVDLDSAQGLVKNSLVRVAGVDVGRVSGIYLKNGKARVAMRIDKGVRIRKDSKVYIKTEGLLGEKYIEIKQGRSKEEVKPNGFITQGAPPVDIDQVIAQLSSIATDIKSVTEPLSKALGGKKGEESIRSIVENIKGVTKDLRNIISRNEKRIDSLLTNLDRFSKDLPEISKDAKSMVASLNNIAGKIERGEGTLGKLVSDKELYDELRETLSSLNRVAKKMEKGEGTLGKLVSDKEMYDDLKETVKSLKVIAKKIEKGEGTLGKLVNDKGLYEDARKALKNINKSTEGIQEQIPLTTLGVVVGTVVH